MKSTAAKPDATRVSSAAPGGGVGDSMKPIQNTPGRSLFNMLRKPRLSGVSSAVRALALSGLVLAAAAIMGVATPAMADFPPPGEDGGSDPTVGTLPMVGDTDAEFLDQTVTLRGRNADLRTAIVSVTGDGAYESIDLGDGRSWIRYYGDVQLELDLASLAEVEVEIFTGFEGGGLSYSVGQANGFGSVRRAPTGSVIRLDPIRFTNTGLLNQTLFVAGFHQIGVRTMTSLDLVPTDGTIVIRQDV